MIEKDKNNQELLKQNWELLIRSLDSLKLSVEKVSNIGQKTEYTFEELESFDSLTSKFARTSDIFLQKIIRTIWALLHETQMPLIDVLNKSEKLGLIESADQLIEIRDIRNQIAHEYLPEAIQDLVPDVLEYSKQLEYNIRKCQQFISQRNWI